MEEVKLKILQFFKDLEFEEDTHKYSVGGKPIKNSVSGLIKFFHNPFDTNTIAERYAAKHGLRTEDVIEKWNTASELACARGTEAHLFGELYPFDRGIKAKTGYEKAIKAFWDDLPDFLIPVMTECKMYHKEQMWAGTMDILLYNRDTGTYVICDYKTNQDLFKNFKGNRMINEFNHLVESPYNKYQLQLSFYQILIEQIEGIKISSRKIIWIKDSGEYQIYSTDDYTEILKDYFK